MKTESAFVLYVTLLSFVLYLFILQIAVFAGARLAVGNYAVQGCAIAASLVSYGLLRMGYVRSVGLWMIGSTFIATTIALQNIGTIRAPLTSVYLALVFIAGILFELRGVVVMSVLGSAAVGLLIIAQNNGLLPPAETAVGTTQWVTYTGIFITNGGLIGVVLRSLRKALRRAESEIAERKRIEIALRASEERLQRSNAELQAALADVKTLSGMLPICANCKKIRDDKGYWNRLEEYLTTHTNAELTHGICPDCRRELYPEFEQAP